MPNIQGDANPHEQRILSNNNKKTYENQFEELIFSKENNPTPQNYLSLNEHKLDTSKIEIERNMMLQKGISKFDKSLDMTYGITSPDNFVHNNMVPFISGNARGYGDNSVAEEQLNNFKTRKVEMFSGSLNNVDYQRKKESKTFF